MLFSAEVSFSLACIQTLNSLRLGAESDFILVSVRLRWSCSVTSRWWIGCSPRLAWKVEGKGRERCSPSGSIWTRPVNAAVFTWWSAQPRTGQALSTRSVSVVIVVNAAGCQRCVSSVVGLPHFDQSLKSKTAEWVHQTVPSYTDTTSEETVAAYSI